MPDTRKPARRLWDRFWVRLPASLIGAPLVIFAVDVVAAIAILVAIDDEPSQIFYNIPIIAIWAVAQIVPLIVPLILVELGNRRRRFAVPPGLCTLFVAAFSLALTGTIYSVVMVTSEIPGAYRFTSGVPFGVALVLGSCTVAGVISWALVSPLFRRWTLRNASAKDVAEHF